LRRHILSKEKTSLVPPLSGGCLPLAVLTGDVADIPYIVSLTLQPLPSKSVTAASNGPPPLLTTILPSSGGNPPREDYISLPPVLMVSVGLLPARSPRFTTVCVRQAYRQHKSSDRQTSSPPAAFHGEVSTFQEHPRVPVFFALFEPTLLPSNGQEQPQPTSLPVSLGTRDGTLSSFLCLPFFFFFLSPMNTGI